MEVHRKMKAPCEHGWRQPSPSAWRALPAAANSTQRADLWSMVLGQAEPLEAARIGEVVSDQGVRV